MKRKQIAAANWKMNLTLPEAETLLTEIAQTAPKLDENRQAVFAVPFPYLQLAQQKLQSLHNYFVSAQDCSAHENGAYTGEVSAAMLSSMGITHVIIGHSERREYHLETAALLAKKIDRVMEQNMKPIFCCGEPLEIREAGTQNNWVEKQINDSLFHLTADKINNFIIAYEPIWAIGTGKTASSEQAQEMHAHIRAVITDQYGVETANTISILYGGSVKADNAAEIFGKPDVDGGLVGGASLNHAAFTTIIQGLK